MAYAHDNSPSVDGDACKADMQRLIDDVGYSPIVADDIIGTPYAEGYSSRLSYRHTAQIYNIIRPETDALRWQNQS